MDNGYLLCFLQSPKGRALLKARESGTTVVGIKQSEFRRIQFDLPDIIIQRKISRLFYTIDEKIKINNQINENLVA